MNKLFNKIITMTLGLAMAIGVGVAIGGKGSGDTKSVKAASAQWQLVTSAPSDWSGEYIVASGTSGTIKMLDGSSFTSGAQVCAGVNVTVSNSKITADTADAITIAKSSTNGKYTVKLNGRYIGKNANSNGIDDSTTWSTNYDNEITYSSSKVYIKGNGGRVLSWLASNSNYKYYASSNNVSQLFKKVESATLSSIALSGSYPTTFTQGDVFSHDGMTVTATYSDSSTKDVTSSATFTGYNMSTTGNQTVTVSYTEGGTTKTATYSITVNAPKVLSSISVSGQTTTFNQGDTFVFGGTVTAHYEDTTTADVTSSATFSGYNMSTTGNQTVTVSYTSGSITKTATYGIIVNSVPQYELITSDAGLENGAKYVIGDSTKTHFMSSTQNSNNRGKIDLTPVDDVLTYSDGLEVIELGGSTDSWTLYATKSETKGYLYAAGANSNNYLRTKSESTTWTITFSNKTPTLVSAAATRGTMQYNTSGLFACYGSASQVDVTLWKLVDTTESVSLNKNSVSDMKENVNHEVNITAKNFTPTGISSTYSVANVASVAVGSISNKVINLDITCTGVGTTVATITVNGGEGTNTVDLSITVTQRPASLTLVNGYIDHGEIEVKHGGTRQISFSALDTDGQAYAINYSGITASSSNTNVSLTGTTNMVLNGDNVGDAVVTCTITITADWQNPITQTLTVHVIDDYLTSVNNVTLTTETTNADQGASPTLAIFTSRVGNTHFGNTEDIPLEDFRFSYTDTSGDPASQFSYDFEHGEAVGGGGNYKLQTIYVYCTLGDVKCGTYDVLVKQKDDPLTAITISNVTNHAQDVARGDTFQLQITFTPTNPTDGKGLVYRVDTNDDDIDITVSNTGLISISASSNFGTALVVVESDHDETIFDYVYITAILESMTYVVDEPESWDLTEYASLQTGDYVVIVGDNGSTYALPNNNGTSAPPATAVTIANDKISGNVATTIQWVVTRDGDNIQFGVADSNDYLYCNATNNGVKVGSGDNNVFSIEDDYLYNNGTGRYIGIYSSQDWRCYTTINSNIENQSFSFFKNTGGNTPYTVTETLYSGIHDNFGDDDTTYEWDASCSSFDSSSWQNACNALKGITSYSTYKLDRAVGNMAGNEVEQFIAKYDIIIGKVGKTYDYLGRFSGSGINANQRIGSSVNLFQNADINISAIVIVTSVISVAAIGGYFFLRKKKEQ